MITISAKHAGARNAGSLNHLETGNDNAKVQIFDGSATPLLLVEIQLDKPCGKIVNNQLLLIASQPALIANTGTAVSANIITSSGELAFSCDVSDMSGTGVIKLLTTSLLRGGKTILTSAVIG